MAKTQILIVEDDPAVSKLLTAYLGKEGFETAIAGSVPEMQTAFLAAPPDMIILDVVLPGEDGWSALRWLRARSQVPVIMLTGKGDTVDKVVGLELGADDYLSKPFDLRELLARLRTVQRRAAKTDLPSASPAPTEEVRFQGWVLDLAAQQLRNEQGEVVHLTLAEYRILELLAQAPRQVVTRERLMEAVAGRDWDPMDRSMDVHVSNLRRKLEANPRQSGLIRTVRGSGYMLVPH